MEREKYFFGGGGGGRLKKRNKNGKVKGAAKDFVFPGKGNAVEFLPFLNRKASHIHMTIKRLQFLPTTY